MITGKDVEKLAELARIKITDEEKESFSKEIDSILGYVAEIQKVSNDSVVAPGADLSSARNIVREDNNPNPTGANTEAILREAPYKEGDYIAVKKILS